MTTGAPDNSLISGFSPPSTGRRVIVRDRPFSAKLTWAFLSTPTFVEELAADAAVGSADAAVHTSAASENESRRDRNIRGAA
jgi:hypothetical protein